MPIPPPRPKRAPRLHKKSGHYYAVFYDPSRRPSRKWFALKTDKKRRADKLFHQADEAYFAGTFDPWLDGKVAADPVTLAAAIERYVAYRRSRDWRESTARERQRLLDSFASSMPPGLGPDHVRQSDVEDFVRAAPAEGAGNVRDPDQRRAGTVRTYLFTLAPFFDWCVAERLAERNPAAGIEAPRVERKPVVHLEPKQFEHLVKRIRDDRMLKEATGKLRTGWPREILWLVDAVELAVYTGLRQGELVRLRWRDVALDGSDRASGQGGPVVHVRDTARGRTKTDASKRTVPLVQPAVELLRRLQEERPTENDDDSVLLSPDPREGPRLISAASLRTTFKKYVRLAGLDEALTFHSLRKTCGTWLLNRGVELAVVQRILGHARQATTEAVYTEIWDSTVRRQLDEAFTSVTRTEPA